METMIIQQDIPVFYVEASSFPEGILAAHQQLHSTVPFSSNRRYFGISRPEDEVIRYKAAAEELQPGEAEQFGRKKMVLKKGSYISETIKDYAKDIQVIGKTFEQLMNYPGLDPQGYCVEWYINGTDVQCMIRLEA